MIETLIVLGAITVGVVFGVFKWRFRPAAHTAKVTTAQGTSQPAAKAALVPQVLVGNDDPEVTKVFTFPLAEVDQLRSDISGTPTAIDQDSRGAAPTVSVEATGNELDDYASRVKLNFERDAEAEEATSPAIRILISSSSASDQGLKRKRNEDSLLVLRERSLFAVADGMGGYAGGEMASALAVDVLRDAFERSAFEARTESDVELPRRGRDLACAIQLANEAIYAVAKNDPLLCNMGTTVVAAWFSPNKQRVYIGHVGDSRCYRLRGSVMRQLTMDHTMGNLGMTGPHSKELFQAVGVKPTMVIDLIVDKPLHDDLYLLCSDGLSKMVSDEEVQAVLMQEPDVDAAVYRLIEIANQHGGRDNTSIILVKVVERMPGAYELGAHPHPV